jgi:predicted ATP-dependent serine protease
MPHPCFSTGLADLDAIIGEGCPGIPRGGLTVIVGETGAGKSSLCRVIAHNVATQHTQEEIAFRVGLADIETGPDPTATSYNILSLETMSQLAQILTRPTFDLMIIDGVEYLSGRVGSDPGSNPGTERARQIDSILTRVDLHNLALVLTWQDCRFPLLTHRIPALLAHRASLILRVEDHGKRVRVTKNRFGDHGVAEFGPRWREIPRELLEPEFDRSLIKTRFEREDVI